MDEVGSESTRDWLALAAGLGAVLTVLAVGRFQHGHVCGQGLARNPIVFCGPCPQIGQLATFRAERTPGVSFPCCGVVAQGTRHIVSVTWVRGEEKS